MPADNRDGIISSVEYDEEKQLWQWTVDIEIDGQLQYVAGANSLTKEEADRQVEKTINSLDEPPDGYEPPNCYVPGYGWMVI